MVMCVRDEVAQCDSLEVLIVIKNPISQVKASTTNRQQHKNLEDQSMTKEESVGKKKNICSGFSYGSHSRRATTVFLVSCFFWFTFSLRYSKTEQFYGLNSQ
jgi:hypothetical protein